MISKNLKKIIINEKSAIKFALKKLKISGTRCLIVTDSKNNFLGTCSDGDIRKKILDGYTLHNKITDVYNKKAYYINKDRYSSFEIEKKMNNGIDLIPVLNKSFNLIDVVMKSNIKRFINVRTKNKKNFSAIIMAGGVGSRLKPFTNVLPKSLIPLNGKPIIELIIENLRKNGFYKIYISINKNDFILKSFFEQKKIKGIKFIEENKPLGPLGALSKLKKNRNDFLITNCDTYFDFDINKLIDNHNSSNSKCTVVISKNTTKSKYGHCVLDNKKKFLLEIEEKPKYSYLFNVGIYVISREILSIIPKKYFTILDLIQILKKKEILINTFLVQKPSWFDAGNWEDYNKIKNKIFLPNSKKII
tara:strand:+ start:897 stop:1979 length:1083 start_codon:yes stop_codon:yes gene_type:complete